MAHFRLAPTPSGYIHEGNILNFLLTAKWAERVGAKLTLRIDDLDQTRAKEAYYESIRQALRRYLPNQAEELWSGAIRQSERIPRYEAVLAGLRQNQLVFACACTRSELRAAQAARAFNVNVYPGTCTNQNLSLDLPNVAWRLKSVTPQQITWQEANKSIPFPFTCDFNHFVLRQKNGLPSYQLASLVDDIELGITHVCRGKDLLESTAMQLVLAKALEQLDPQYGNFKKLEFFHHDLLTDSQGEKLSKSAGRHALPEQEAENFDEGLVDRFMP